MALSEQKWHLWNSSIHSYDNKYIYAMLNISSDPVPMEARSGRRERPTTTGQGTQVRRTLAPSQPQVLGGTTEAENSEELSRYRWSLINGHFKKDFFSIWKCELVNIVFCVADTQNSSTEGEGSPSSLTCLEKPFDIGVVRRISHLKHVTHLIHWLRQKLMLSY